MDQTHAEAFPVSTKVLLRKPICAGAAEEYACASFSDSQLICIGE